MNKKVFFILLITFFIVGYFCYQEYSRRLIGDRLLFVANVGNIDRVKYYVEEIGVPIDYVNSDVGRALDQAVLGGHKDIIQYLLDNGADINQQGGKYNPTPAHRASAKGDLEIVKFLVDHGADCTLLTDDDFARALDRDDVVRYLEQLT